MGSRKQERTCSFPLLSFAHSSTSALSLSLFFILPSFPSTNASGCSASTFSCRGWNSSMNPSVASNYHEKRKHLRQRDFGGLSDSFRTTCAPEKLDETSPSTLSSSPSAPDGRGDEFHLRGYNVSTTMDGRRWRRDGCGSGWFIMPRPWISRRMVNNNASWNNGSLVNWIIDANICVNTRTVDWANRFFSLMFMIK